MKGSFNMQDKLKPILNKVNKKMKAEDLKNIMNRPGFRRFVLISR